MYQKKKNVHAGRKNPPTKKIVGEIIASKEQAKEIAEITFSKEQEARVET
tara:strand:+ start:572 stop:721 length:150 start_codon:yes stop_codon:yes gene_type:complete